MVKGDTRLFFLHRTLSHTSGRIVISDLEPLTVLTMDDCSSSCATAGYRYHKKFLIDVETQANIT